MDRLEKFGVGFFVAIVLLCMFLFVGYIKNIVKLGKLDFQEPYKAEVIRMIGVFPPVGMIAGWVNIED